MNELLVSYNIVSQRTEGPECCRGDTSKGLKHLESDFRRTGEREYVGGAGGMFAGMQWRMESGTEEDCRVPEKSRSEWLSDYGRSRREHDGGCLTGYAPAADTVTSLPCHVLRTRMTVWSRSSGSYGLVM
jgi:hypothetical protein